MTSSILRAALVLGLLGLAGCAIEEIDESRESGVLYFKAINALDAGEAVAGLLEISGHGAQVSPGDGSYLVVRDLPLDSNLVLHFTPSAAEDWFPTENIVFRFPARARADTLTQLCYPRADSLLSVTVRTISGSGERGGMPLWLDGARWPQDSPATLYFTSLSAHTLVVGDASCTRADTTFSFSVQPAPPAELLVDVGTVSLGVDPGPDAVLLVDETEVGPGLWQQTDPAMGSYFFSAFRAGHAATPAWVRLGGLCGGERAFTWTAVDEGYTAGRLFPDFTLDRVSPGQAGTLGPFSLRRLRGRLVLVTFWYATCVNCLLEMPGFQEMLEQYAPRGFRIAALDPYATDYPENYPPELAAYDFIFLRDVATPPAQPVAQLAGVGAFPTNFIILPDGTVHSVRGGMTVEALEPILLEWLPE